MTRTVDELSEDIRAVSRRLTASSAPHDPVEVAELFARLADLYAERAAAWTVWLESDAGRATPSVLRRHATTYRSSAHRSATRYAEDADRWAGGVDGDGVVRGGGRP